MDASIIIFGSILKFCSDNGGMLSFLFSDSSFHSGNSMRDVGPEFEARLYWTSDSSVCRGTNQENGTELMSVFFKSALQVYEKPPKSDNFGGVSVII